MGKQELKPYLILKLAKALVSGKFNFKQSSSFDTNTTNISQIVFNIENGGKNHVMHHQTNIQFIIIKELHYQKLVLKI